MRFWDNAIDIVRKLFGMNKTNAENEKAKACSKGRVKWFNTEKGFGFIEREDGGEDCFVHHAGLEGPIRYLREGEIVEFEIKKTEKGFRAIKVRSVGRK